MAALLAAGPLLVLGLVTEILLTAGALDEPVAGFGDVLYLALIAGAAGLLLLRALIVVEERAGWLLLGLGVTSFLGGELAWTLASGYVGVPSIADVLWLGFLPLSYAGLVTLLRGRVRTLHRELWIDGIAGALFVAAVVVALAFDALVAGTGGEPLTVAVNLAYPIGDLVLITLVVAVVALTGWRPGRGWPLILVGLFTVAVADVIWLWQSSAGTYVDGTLVDSLWPAGMLALGAAAWQPSAERVSVRLDGRAALAAPMGLALGSLALLAASRVVEVNDAAIALAIAALLGVLLRSALTFRDNLRLLAQSRADALTDALTGLGNRRRLLADLEAELPAAPGTHRMLVLLDLDGFKDYNDAYGHPAGDALLVRLARKLDAEVRRFGGSAYRIGGDEFCALIGWEPTAHADRVVVVAAALAESGGAFDVRASYGAVALATEADDPAAALQLADTRMYASKGGSGRSPFAREARAVLLEALGAREPDLREHVDSVAELCRAVAVRMGMDAEELDEVVRAAELHDIGKLAIPDTILQKPAPLDAAEWEFMHRHTLIGESILSAAPALRPVARIVRSTHERWDGRGYPDRLAGEEIPLGARIVFVCDTFHAMVSDRCYRRAVTVERALAELRSCAGAQFDPRVVSAFCAVLAERRRAPGSPVAA